MGRKWDVAGQNLEKIATRLVAVEFILGKPNSEVGPRSAAMGQTLSFNSRENPLQFLEKNAAPHRPVVIFVAIFRVRVVDCV